MNTDNERFGSALNGEPLADSIGVDAANAVTDAQRHTDSAEPFFTELPLGSLALNTREATDEISLLGLQEETWGSLKRQLRVSQTWASHHGPVYRRFEVYQAHLGSAGEINAGPFIVLLEQNNGASKELAALAVNMSFVDTMLSSSNPMDSFPSLISQQEID